MKRRTCLHITTLQPTAASLSYWSVFGNMINSDREPGCRGSFKEPRDE